MHKNITSAAKQYKEQFDYFQLTAEILSNSKFCKKQLDVYRIK